jgi:hypothetical protein
VCRRRDQQRGGCGDHLHHGALFPSCDRFHQEAENRTQLARWDTIGTLAAFPFDIIALFPPFHCYGGAFAQSGRVLAAKSQID